MKYVPTIGLEVHAQLNTRTKMFCESLSAGGGSAFGGNDPAETKPNVNVCPICLAHPGTLPVPNIEAIKKVVKVGLALHCNIREFSYFERKNYFYPDLPKGYQISQYEAPFCEEGGLKLASGKKIRIRRVHLEEDTGRLLHDPKNKVSLVDFNRAGVPLMELVTEPDIESAKEAKEFGEELQLLLRYLDVSGADMERGQLRLEANISLLPSKSQIPNSKSQKLGTKVEIKNINSFRALERAIDYEIRRQSELLDNGKLVVQETRGWDETSQRTVAQRTKEESEDYRYFPEPDIPPIKLEQAQIEAIRAELPELPAERRARLEKEYGIKPADAEIFTVQKELGDYFEEVVSELRVTSQESRVIKLSANYLITELQKLMTHDSLPITQIKITPENFAELIVMIEKGTVSSTGAQQILKAMFVRGIDPSQLLEELNLTQVSDEEELRQAALLVIEENPKAVADYKKGKEASLVYLVGQLMRHTHGRANPQVASSILKKLLD